MSVTCKACGITWVRDPAIEVACPKCRANVGVHCKRPSGHECDVHAERDRLAMAEGFLRPCPAVTRGFVADAPEQQADLFEALAA